jgi:hypothetical protein
LILAPLALRPGQSRSPGIPMVGALLVSTALLSLNDVWNLHNHPYRFEIHLLFPLAILAADTLVRVRKPAVWALGAWLVVNALLNISLIFSGERPYFHVTSMSTEETKFLQQLRDVTRAAPGEMYLNPPEFRYPYGVVQSSILANYSAIPAYIPDYRYIADTAGFAERMKLFCSLFPKYPAYEVQLEVHDCLGINAPAPTDAELRDKHIRFAAAMGEPFFSTLAQTAQARKWTVKAEAVIERDLLVEIPGP